MTDTVTHETVDAVRVIRFDDGKANVLSFAATAALRDAVKEASADDAVRAIAVIGRPGRFSAGLDVKIAKGDPAGSILLSAELLELTCDIYSAPKPVVIGCTGHAIAGGATLLLSGDTRVGAAGDFQIGLNEVRIGVRMPKWTQELAKERLNPAAWQRAIALGHLFTPDDARAAGYLDIVTAPDTVEETTIAEAQALTALDLGAYGAVIADLRGDTVQILRSFVDIYRNRAKALTEAR